MKILSHASLFSAGKLNHGPSDYGAAILPVDRHEAMPPEGNRSRRVSEGRTVVWIAKDTS
jgi:hypothetical protein